MKQAYIWYEYSVASQQKLLLCRAFGDLLRIYLVSKLSVSSIPDIRLFLWCPFSLRNGRWYDCILVLLSCILALWKYWLVIQRRHTWDRFEAVVIASGLYWKGQWTQGDYKFIVAYVQSRIMYLILVFWNWDDMYGLDIRYPCVYYSIVCFFHAVFFFTDFLVASLVNKFPSQQLKIWKTQ